MTIRPDRDDDDQPTWRQTHIAVQPPLDIKDRLKKARETLARTVTKEHR